jgi:hypothetical protein
MVFTRTCWSMFQKPVWPWKFQYTAMFAFWCCAACAGVTAVTNSATTIASPDPTCRNIVDMAAPRKVGAPLTRHGVPRLGPAALSVR